MSTDCEPSVNDSFSQRYEKYKARHRELQRLLKQAAAIYLLTSKIEKRLEWRNIFEYFLDKPTHFILLSKLKASGFGIPSLYISTKWPNPVHEYEFSYYGLMGEYDEISFTHEADGWTLSLGTHQREWGESWTDYDSFKGLSLDDLFLHLEQHVSKERQCRN